MSGYIKDWRKELESDIWTMPPLYHRVWQWLKYTANKFEKTIVNPDGTSLTIKPGQKLTSYRQIAEQIAWKERKQLKVPNVKTIMRVIHWLESQNMIAVRHGKGNREYTLITLVNYEVYQSNEKETETANGTGDGIGRGTGDGIGRGTGDGIGAGYKQESKEREEREEDLAPEKPAHPIWGDGLQLLLDAGVSEVNARRFLGRALNQSDEETVSNAISATLLADPADPKSYLIGCLKNAKEKAKPKPEDDIFRGVIW